MAHADDPYALNADGTAADPLAFQAALRADASKMAELEADPELQGVLLGPDTAAMQALLQQAFQAQMAKAKDMGRWMAERTIDAQRASATVPRDTVQLYAQLAQSGLQYGPAFRLLRNVHVPDTN
ncbi:hypothetical protein MNEG_2495 [Monoraphidium neglectum]|uniref:Polyketide synthase dehydratase domain-containing protein n=1 Tax=Monoraphidium neglectum TaxID=145388 RepID=A0A0D2MYN3_9CHLO|nr:hypothetical protein MNEG_2495 [Monoraphidium neglectum]KIZ05467.1 hypothetical protein MNEG_2495 [Monoraphidium neglectum]|eukprot:XP_013904486.1 hypothetical protein MNEG_2495 [Monoraphidium neglectum]